MTFVMECDVSCLVSKHLPVEQVNLIGQFSMLFRNEFYLPTFYLPTLKMVQ